MLRVIAGTILAAAAAVLLTSCEREERTFRVEPPYVAGVAKIPVTSFGAGGPATNPVTGNEYEENAYAMAEGKRLYLAYNCVGCHANGGGGMGPPLIDDTWVYGSAPEQVYATIVEGRPNGMPSFAGRIPTPQVWMLVAYVRSLSGQAPAWARSARQDHLMNAPGSQSLRKPETPKQSFRPPASEMP